MSGLLGSLSVASRSLEAQQYGLEVTGQNMANVNTAGYVRREVLLAPAAATDPRGAYGGVDVVGARATRDRFLERRLLMERPAEQREQVIANALSLAEVAFGQPGQGLDASMDAFFGRASKLATDPTSITMRHEYVAAGEQLARGFRDMVSRLNTAQRDADSNVRSAVAEANTMARQIASLNASIGLSGDQAANHGLFDRQRLLVDTLAAVIDIDIVQRADGGIDISTAGGRALVIGEGAYELRVSSAPPHGFAEVTYDSTAISRDIVGGKVGGHLQVRDTLVPSYLDALDDLATSLATEVNALHTAGFDASGAAGVAFFTLTGGVPPAAGLAVNAIVRADPWKVAAGGSAAHGDNQNARALAALRDGRILNGGTLTDAWASLVHRVGADTQAAQQEQVSRQDIVRQIEALRESVSGVSLDEEAMMMMRFQRAYEANARYFQAIDQSLETLLNLV